MTMIAQAEQKPNTETQSDWKKHALAIYQAAVQQDEDAIRGSQAEKAAQVLEELAAFDPPILAAFAVGDRAEADGVVFGFHSEYGRQEKLTIFQRCARCGQEVASRPLRKWNDVGFCLAVSPAEEAAARRASDLPALDSAWRYHRCLEPDPADLVSIVRHLLLFAYDHNTGEPKIPIYAVRRAENALAAFEKGGD